MKRKTTPEAILSRFVKHTLNLGWLNARSIQEYLASEVEATIRRAALPGLGPAVREWAYNTIKLTKPVKTRNVDEIVFTLLMENCRFWEPLLICDALSLEPGYKVALLSADLNAISITEIERACIDKPSDIFGTSLAVNGYRLDRWGTSISEARFDESTMMVYEDTRPPVRIAEINHHVLELVGAVKQLRECQNKIKSMQPQTPSEVHLLREEVNRLESTLVTLNRLGVTHMVTWE